MTYKPRYYINKCSLCDGQINEDQRRAIVESPVSEGKTLLTIAHFECAKRAVSDADADDPLL